jgi:hypothetical protein
VVFNSTVIRINKFGSPQGVATASANPFAIDGTLAPAPNSFYYAPFSVISRNRAFFCTPNGVRVMRSSASNVSVTPGIDSPTPSKSNSFVNQGGAFIGTLNDFALIATNTSAATAEIADCKADTAISYVVVLRKTLPDGSFLESSPSPAIYGYNTMTARAISVSASTMTITQTSHGFAAASKGILKANRLYGGSTLFPLVEGEYTWTYATADTYTIVIPPNQAGSLPVTGTMFCAQDRFSFFRCNFSLDVAVDDFIDVYSSSSEISLSENPLATPDGDYYLAREVKVTTLTSKYIDIDMKGTIFQKGVPLYTNPSDGDLSRQPNTIPPGAGSIEIWKGCMFYANTFRRHTINVTQVGGLISGSTDITLKYTDTGAQETFPSPLFNGSSSRIIRWRVMDLVTKINTESAFFYARFSQNTSDFPGELIIESRNPNRAFGIFSYFSIIAVAESTARTFEPILGFTDNPVVMPANSPLSTQEIGRNRIYWSKQNQPESVPFFIDVGSSDEDILRISRTRESLIVVKRDGIFSLFGDPTTGGLLIREIDNTIKGISSTGVARLGNRVFAKTNQGIVGISETSISLVSRTQIESLVKISDEESTRSTVMYGLEDDRQLYIATATNPSVPTKTVYSYNVITQTWSEISKIFTWGFVVDNNFTVSKLFQNNRVITDGTSVFMERKDSLLTDWTETDVARTVSAISADKLTLTLNVAFTGSIGSVLSWTNGTGAIKLYRVTAVSGLTVTLILPFSGAVSSPVTLYTPIKSTIRTVPIDGGDSSIVKQFTKFIMNMRYDAFSVATISFRSDYFEYGFDVVWEKLDERRGWGQEAFGRFPWGQATAEALQYLTMPSQIVQTEVPRTQQSSTYLQAEIVHNVACEGMFIQQMAFELRTSSERPAR